MATAAKSWFSIRNLSGGDVELSIMDEIGAWGVSAKDFANSFQAIDPGARVNLHIFSPGGDISDGNEIYNTLMAHKGEVNVTIGALCASMATVIAMAGDSVTMADNGFFMIHNPYVMTMGDSDNLRDMADVMDSMKANIISAYQGKTGLGADVLSQMMDAETWMTADEAKAKGFVDNIASDLPGDGDLTNFNLSRFKNSASFLSKLTSNANAREPGSASGDGQRVVTLSDLKNAQANTRKTFKSKDKPNMSAIITDDAATKAEISRLATEQAKNLFREKQARDGEIDTITAALIKRDNRDFTDLAAEYKAADKSAQEFAMAAASSDKFKTVTKVGAGADIELTEPLDSVKGTPGFLFVNSEKYRHFADSYIKGQRHDFRISLTIPAGRIGSQFRNAQTSSGLTSIEYLPGIYELGVRPLKIKDLIMGGVTSGTTIRYRQENAFADAAAPVTETGALPNVGVSYQEVDAPVQDIGGYIEESENLMADYLAIASFINMRLPYMVERATEDQLLNGSGTAPALTGILNQTGVQTLAVSGTAYVDALFNAITNVRWVPNGVQANAQGGYEPDAIVINPADWQTIRLQKDSNGQYYAGGPFTGAYGNGQSAVYDVLWGKLVCVTPAIAQGTALVGAFKQCAQWFQRQGLTIEMTNSNGTNFVNRIVTLRAAERLALAVPLPNGFCQVTGL